MAVKLVFLGRLEDIAGAAERLVPVGNLGDVTGTLEPALSDAIANLRIRIALNGALIAARADIALADGDEVAFLPPVSGGE